MVNYSYAKTQIIPIKYMRFFLSAQMRVEKASSIKNFPIECLEFPNVGIVYFFNLKINLLHVKIFNLESGKHCLLYNKEPNCWI